MSSPTSASSRAHHQLSNIDPEAREADCSVCEKRVSILKSGKGGKYSQCAVAHRALVRTRDQLNLEKAAARKRPGVSHQIIAANFLDRTGYCTDCKQIVDLVPWGKGLVCSSRDGMLRLDSNEAGFPRDSYFVVAPSFDPYKMPEYESAVPGWKTLGKNAPHEPRHAKPESLSFGKYQIIDGTLGARP